ncbi:hypothetical protein NQ176_g5673 [Zarea fungicola]|uniref:Uncharacterized protein n=1 Tax=Zarea fungicola TaxID=93591 RepID=A0ACC1N8P7_9HYPO|nr:hypothetical protein NQ176_g5673 [Lecanicillium fungicola]
MLVSSLYLFVAIVAAFGYNDTLIDCLSNITSAGGRLVAPSSSDYAQDRYGFNYYFSFNPRAIYHPATNADAAAAIKCAATNGVAIAPRSGGHSYEGYSEGGRDGALVIDLDQFMQFSIDNNTGIATIGAGYRLGPLYTSLWENGQYLIPAGTCPSVGIGGHALGGGLGLTGRKYGMASDNIVRMTMINARGEILDISPWSHRDLFWALRGAGGGSFGLVTEFQIQAYKAPPKVTTFQMYYPLTNFSTVLDVYANLSTITDDAMMEMNVGQDGLGIQGTFLGNSSDATALVSKIAQAAGQPDYQEVDEGTWFDAVTQWAWILNGTLAAPILGDARYARGGSLIYRQSLTLEEKNIIYKYLTNPAPEASASYIIIDIWGGKVDRPMHPSAFDAHRGVRFGIEFISEAGDPSSTPGLTCPTCLDWSQNFAKDMRTAYATHHQLEAYQNYIERDLSIDAYYGHSLPRLKQIKKAADPKNVFTFPQAIPLP